MARELDGKVAIVTGGAKGLGRGTVEVFVEEGAQVIIADVDAICGTELARRLGDGVRFKRTDVSRREDMEAVVDFAIREFGGLHVMCNNAGTSDFSYGRLLDDDFKRFEEVMRVNVLGVMLGIQAAARHMVKNGGGSIINTSSIGGIKAGGGLPVYRTSKAGIIHYTRSAAVELGEHLVRVNCICPGNIPTDLGTFSAPPPGMAQPDADRMQREILAVRMSRQPLKRQAQPRDIGNAALFFASDRSAQVTGQILCVDGGASAGDPRSEMQEIMDIRAAALSKVN